MHRRWMLKVLWCAVLAGLAAGASPARAEAPPADIAQVDSLVARLQQATAQLRDYRAVLTKQQRIGGKLRALETLRLKHRRAPECRYVQWIEGPNEGREALHCADRNDGKMKVHEGGLLGLVTLSLDPLGERARRDDLRPITQTGIYTVAALVRDDRAHHEGASDAQVHIERRIVHAQASTCMATPSGTSLSQSYAAGRREVCVHDALGLPTEVRIWNQADELMEHYTFRDYALNPGLSDADFDPDNDDYRF